MRNRNSARRPRGTDGGAHWISYSDIMASLLMIFVLLVIVFVFRLTEQSAILSSKEEEVSRQQVIIMGQNESLNVMRIQLAENEAQLETDRIILAQKESELEEQCIIIMGQQEAMNVMQIQLDAQQAQLVEKEQQLAALVGVRSDIIVALQRNLRQNGIGASVDKETGDIVLESSILFDSNKSDLKEVGENELRRFLPVYLDVLLSDEFYENVAEIVIEGHTDSNGTYEHNMKLSSDRAWAVAEFCLGLTSDSGNSAQRERLEKVLTVTGRGEAEPIYFENSTLENKDASRRVVFRFRLKDTEAMYKILQEIEKGN